MARGKTGKEVSVRHSSEAVPAWVTEGNTSTAGTIGQGDIVIPRIKVWQDQSKNKDQYSGIKSGQFYNTVSKEVLGDAVKFFIAIHFKSRMWFTDEFKLRGCEQQNLICKEVKGAKTIEVKGFTQYGPDVAKCIEKEYDEGMDCDNYLVVTEAAAAAAVEAKAMPDIAIYSLMSAARKSAKQLNSKLMSNALRGIPCFGQMIEAETAEEDFKKGSAYMPVFSYGRFADKHEFEMLSSFLPFAVRMIARVESVADGHSE